VLTNTNFQLSASIQYGSQFYDEKKQKDTLQSTSVK
jgi:hypothetical protein